MSSDLQAIIVGVGCRNCETLARLTRELLQELGAGHVPVRQEHPEAGDATWGVVLTPALILDGKLLVTGRIPSTRHLRKLIRETLVPPDATEPE